MPAAYNRYMVQVVWGKGGRCKTVSLPHVFPATREGYTDMRRKLMEQIELLDRIIAAETDDEKARVT